MKNWCFQTVVLKKTLESPLDSKEINPVKEISPEYSLEGLMLKLKLQYLGHLMWRADSLEKTLMLGKIEGRRRRGWKRMRWLGVITDSTDMKSEQAPGGREEQGSLVYCCAWSCNESDTTKQLNNKHTGVYVCVLEQKKWCIIKYLTWILFDFLSKSLSSTFN